MKKEYKKGSRHFDFIPVSKEEAEKIEGQIKDGIPANMFVIRGGTIYCGGDNADRGQVSK